MLSSRRVRGTAFCLLLLVVVGCGGHSGSTPARSGQTVYVTAGGTTGGGAGVDLPSGGTASSSGSASDAGTTSGETTVGSTTGTDVPPTLGDAATDLAFASDGAALRFATMKGTGDAPGYAELDYDYDEGRGDGDLYLYGFLGDWGGPFQEIQLSFEHKTFVKVGTKLKLTYGVYYEHVGEDDYAGWEGIEGTTAEVVAVGPGQSVTVRLDGLRFRSIEDERTLLTVSGTLKSPAEPPVYSTSSGDVGTTGTTRGGIALSRGLTRHKR